MKASVIAISLCCILLALPATAGIEEGLSAARKGDYLTAMRELRPLAIKGDAHAQYYLGRLYENGQGVPQDFREAVGWYRKAALQGDAHAQFNLGNMYYNGHGVPQDYKEAVAWYRKAALQGNADAQNNLGLMYDSGRGVPHNYKEAVAWYRKSALQGEANAQTSLGSIYYNGQGVPQDDKEALVWFRQAAMKGSAEAQFNLGTMYARGRGVPESHVVAYSLWNISAASKPSNSLVTEDRAKLATVMSEREIAAAKVLTREMAKPGNLLYALENYLQRPTVSGGEPTSIALVDSNAGNRAQCTQPGSQEDLIALMRRLPPPKDFGAWGALQAQYDSGHISLLDYCSTRYELAGYVRAAADVAMLSLPKAVTYSNPTYRWSLAYPAGWSLDDNDRQHVVIRLGPALIGIYSFIDVTGKSLDDVADAYLRRWEQLIGGFLPISRRRLTLSNNLPAVEAVYNIGSVVIGRTRIVVTLVKDTAFILDSETYLDSWSSYDRDFNRIIESFRAQQ